MSTESDLPLLAYISAKELARVDDKRTSNLAASGVEVKLSAVQRLFMDSLTHLGSGTANEIALHANPDSGSMMETIRKRASELERRGVIRVADTRCCRVTGKKCSVYEVSMEIMNNGN